MTRSWAPKTNPTETPGLLLMLDGNPTLQKLIATWPNAYLAGQNAQEPK
jgi:hypothetical protein